MRSKIGNKKSNSHNPKDWVNYEFINWTLNNAEKEQFAEWYKENAATAFDDLQGLLASGYKVSISHDVSNDCSIATLTCKEPTDPNYGYCLTSRASTGWEAMAICLFKTFELAKDYEWPKEVRTNNYG